MSDEVVDLLDAHPKANKMNKNSNTLPAGQKKAPSQHPTFLFNRRDDEKAECDSYDRTDVCEFGKEYEWTNQKMLAVAKPHFAMRPRRRSATLVIRYSLATITSREFDESDMRTIALSMNGSEYIYMVKMSFIQTPHTTRTFKQQRKPTRRKLTNRSKTTQLNDQIYSTWLKQ